MSACSPISVRSLHAAASAIVLMFLASALVHGAEIIIAVVFSLDLMFVQWLDYHKQFGVGRIYLIDHLSEVGLLGLQLIDLNSTTLLAPSLAS